MSPNDKAGDLEAKVRQFLKYGASQVWVFYPQTKDVHVLYADSTAKFMDASQRLDGGSLLHGFSVLVEELFAI